MSDHMKETFFIMRNDGFVIKYRRLVPEEPFEFVVRYPSFVMGWADREQAEMALSLYQKRFSGSTAMNGYEFVVVGQVVFD